MNEEEVRKIILEALRSSTETNRVEFKNSRGGYPGNTWQSVSAFLHRPGGGFIVFGVAEDRGKATTRFKVVGAGDISIIQEKVSNLCSNEMSVTIRPEYFIIDIEGEQILAVYIPECPDQFKPCYYKSRGMPNGAYVRDGNTDRKITDEEMRQLLDNAKLSKFDLTHAPDTSLDDLSRNKIYELLIRTGQRVKRSTSSEEVDFELRIINLEVQL